MEQLSGLYKNKGVLPVSIINFHCAYFLEIYGYLSYDCVICVKPLKTYVLF